MNCGGCLRFRSFRAENAWLGHCSFYNKNVNMPDPACENYVDEEVLDAFERLFVNRRDTYAIQQDGTYRRVDGWLTKDVLRRHLAGEITVGAYQIKPKTNMVKWVCFDVDPEHTEHPEADVLNIFRACLENQRVPLKSIVLEASRHPDPSYHLWIFFEPSLPAVAAQWLAKTILEKAGVVCEVFPKQGEVKEGEFGNLMKLPLGLHREEKKWSRFLDPITMSPLQPSYLLTVEPTSLPEKDIQRILNMTKKEKKLWFDREDLAQKPYRGKDPACILGLAKGVSEGWRNEAAIRLATYMVNFKRLKTRTAWSKLFEWNAKNRPPLDVRELKTVFDSALEKGYTYGCDDELLKKYCVREGCKLAKELSGIELIQQELEKQKAVRIHPLLDYHPDVGLTIGALLGKSSQALIFMAKKAFTVEFETPLLEETFANSISISKPKWAELTPNFKKQMLLLAGDYFSGKQIVFPSKKEVFQKVFEKVSYYYWHSDNRWLVLITCWIIGTCFHVVFVFFPALCLQGERETGKSTLLEVLRKIAWNATGREVALREADLFRTIEDSRVTYLADITKLNPKSKSYQDVVDVFETGTEKGGCVRRIDKDTGKPINWKTFGPKAVATRYELPFLPKTIRIITEKAENRVYSSRRGEIEFDEEFPEIVGLLIKGVIKYWPEVVEAYKNMKQTKKLRGRPFNYWSPVLAICNVFAPEHYDSLLELAEEEAEKAERGDRLSEVEECILTILFEFKGKATSILLKELTGQVQERVPWVKDWHIVRSAVTNLGIAKRYYSTGGGKAYEFDLERARKKAEVRGITLEEMPSAQPTEKAKEPTEGIVEEWKKRVKTNVSPQPRIDEWNWESFHAVGRSTPEGSWQKTVQAVETFRRQEGRLPTRQELQNWDLQLYWRPEDIPKVLEKLAERGLVAATNIEEMFASTCFVCGKPLPMDLAYCTTLGGKPLHLKCYRRLKAQQKKVGEEVEQAKGCRRCRHLTKLGDDPRPWCSFLQAFLADEALSQPCDGYEEKDPEYTTCPRCGAKVLKHTVFCGKCGFRLIQSYG